MNKIYKNLFTLISVCSLLFIPNIIQAKMIKTNSIKNAQNRELKNWIDKDTIIFINIEDTLFRPSDEIFRISSPYRLILNSLKTESANSAFINQRLQEWYIQSKFQLVETEWVDFINSAKQSGAKIYGVYESLLPAEIIYSKIRKLLSENNIVFSLKLADKEEIIFKENQQNVAFFQQGVIFTSALLPASTLLTKLIAEKTISPKKMLVIDHRNPSLKKIDKNLRLYDLKFYNLEYRQVFIEKANPEHEIVKIQRQNLMENGVWLNDQEAKNSINK